MHILKKGSGVDNDDHNNGRRKQVMHTVMNTLFSFYKMSVLACYRVLYLLDLSLPSNVFKLSFYEVFPPIMTFLIYFK
jgi:hypothetical protein